MVLLGSSLPIPLVCSQLSLPLFLFGQHIEPLMGSLCPLPKHCLVSPISGRFIQIIQFFFEQPAACSEGVPRLPILPSLLWTSVGLTFFCRYFHALLFSLQGLYSSLFIFSVRLR